MIEGIEETTEAPIVIVVVVVVSELAILIAVIYLYIYKSSDHSIIIDTLHSIVDLVIRLYYYIFIILFFYFESIV